jgi:hypothetical protein
VSVWLVIVQVKFVQPDVVLAVELDWTVDHVPTSDGDVDTEGATGFATDGVPLPFFWKSQPARSPTAMSSATEKRLGSIVVAFVLLAGRPGGRKIRPARLWLSVSGK